MIAEAFSGVVLLGGASRRFGTDKAVAPFGPRTMGEQMIEVLRAAGAQTVVTVGGPDRGFGVLHLPDLHPGQGPLGGIRTAFDQVNTPIVVVVACDLPRLRPSTIERLVAISRSQRDADVVAAHTDRVEPLCASYRVSACAPSAKQMFDAGERSVLRFLQSVKVHSVVLPDFTEVKNVNTPADHVSLDPMAVEEISVRELATAIGSGTPVFDVREPDEYEAGHVPGAVPVPLGEVMARVAEFPSDASFAVICRSGARSMRAAVYLHEQGRTCVNVAGGTMAWIEAGFEVAVGTDKA